ncbi:MAG TPA: O-antigen ligase family protein [Solirubrobacterales bacterium]|nr:O-antigen ligase family protein [Solirubrobacterales bacterium]
MAAEGDEGLSRAGVALPRVGTAVLVTGFGLLAGLVLFAALRKVGAVGVVAPALAVALVVLLRIPALTVALLLVGVVLLEPSEPGLLPTVNSFYTVVKASLTPIDVLLVVGLGGLLLRFAIDGERPRLPEPLTGALGLMGLATIFGIVTAYAAHAGVSSGEIYHRGMNNVYLIFVPLLVVNVLRDTRALKLFLLLAAGLASFKGLSGAYSALSGGGSQLTEETISYLEPVPNLVMLSLVLGTAAALVRRQRLPLWILGGSALSVLALLLSYRRSFWIAAIFGLIVVIIIASRRRGRAIFAIGAAAAALTFVTIATVGGSGPKASPIVKRAEQLSPAGIQADRGDRYRNDERRNVLENLEEHPLTGLGLGVPWKVRAPLAEAHDRSYVHLALLWYWLAYGPLGTIAYAFVMAAALWTAWRVWRRHPDPIVQIGAIAAFGTVLGIVVVELTATFTGVEPRFSIVLGALLGWLAAAWADLPRRQSLPAAGQ